MGADAGGRALQHGAPLGGALARAVHDMRAPLTVICGVCDMLGRGGASPECRRGLRAIDGEARRLSAALDDLLSVRGGPVGVPVDLAAMAAAAVERHRWVAREREVRLALRVAARPVVEGDADRLTRALDNLLRNAVRHCARGGHVRVGLSARGDWAHLCVRDDGPGVPDGDREAIFTAGGRGSAPRGHGQGLGLAIAREIAGDHGGVLTLDRAGSGACFRLVLPSLGHSGDSPRAA